MLLEPAYDGEILNSTEPQHEVVVGDAKWLRAQGRVDGNHFLVDINALNVADVQRETGTQIPNGCRSHTDADNGWRH